MRRALVTAVLIVACGAPAQPTVVIRPLSPCAGVTEPVDRALCVVRDFIAAARKQKDIIKLVCLRDKEAQLETLCARRDETTNARAVQLEHESERCIGELARTLHDERVR